MSMSTSNTSSAPRPRRSLGDRAAPGPRRIELHVCRLYTALRPGGSGNQSTTSARNASGTALRTNHECDDIAYLQALSTRTATPLEPWTFRVSVSTSIYEPEKQKIVDLQALQAADGTRTHDLLHGKQTQFGRTRRFLPAIATFRRGRPATRCVRFRRVSTGFCQPIVNVAIRAYVEDQDSDQVVYTRSASLATRYSAGVSSSRLRPRRASSRAISARARCVHSSVPSSPNNASAASSVARAAAG